MYIFSLAASNVCTVLFSWTYFSSLRRTSIEILNLSSKISTRINLGYYKAFVFISFLLSFYIFIATAVLFHFYYEKSFEIIFGKQKCLSYVLLLAFYVNTSQSVIASPIYATYGTIILVQIKHFNLLLTQFLEFNYQNGDESSYLRKSDPSNQAFQFLLENINNARKNYQCLIKSIGPLLFSEKIYKIYLLIAVFYYSFVTEVGQHRIYLSFSIEIAILLLFYYEAYLADIIINEVRNFYYTWK